ncbi:PEP-CTERM sorting domain-containing protein [Parasalinivibrio latis]|uniref:PEP-CTERM sorting domain-containing protein n=1 Tax=Parasalinivibrio latis TaxID=2952610 RepID=UPI0030E552C8
MKKPFLTFISSLIALVSLFITPGAYSAFYTVDITDPASYNAIYDPKDGASLDRLLMVYDSDSDMFSLQYDFTSSNSTQLGDAYIKFTNNGLVPNGNTGDGNIPWYRFNAETQTVQISNANVSITRSFDYHFDNTTRKGSIFLSHSASDVFSYFQNEPGITNWSGGSFSDKLGLWSHLVSTDFYKTGPNGLERDPNVSPDPWIAYDVHEPLISVVLTENPIPEPAGLLVFAGALLGLFTARKYRKA